MGDSEYGLLAGDVCMIEQVRGSRSASVPNQFFTVRVLRTGVLDQVQRIDNRFRPMEPTHDA